MGETGILVEDEHVELIHGAIIVSEPIGTRHAGTVNRLTRLFMSRLGDRVVVHVQNPIEMAKERSEPQPDVALLRPRADFYAAAHPMAADAAEGARYRERSVIERGQRLTPGAFPELTLSVEALIG